MTRKLPRLVGATQRGESTGDQDKQGTLSTTDDRHVRWNNIADDTIQLS